MWETMTRDGNTLKYQSEVRMKELMKFVEDVKKQMVMKLEKKTHVGQHQPSEKTKNDLAKAISEIRIEYTMLSKQAKTETENWYHLKVCSIAYRTSAPMKNSLTLLTFEIVSEQDQILLENFYYGNNCSHNELDENDI
jgi:hypothetical protein